MCKKVSISALTQPKHSLEGNINSNRYIITQKERPVKMDNYIIKIGKECKAVEINPDELQLDLQEAVGGLFETMRLTNELLMVINEFGALQRLPLNEKASSISGHNIYGEAVILGKGLQPLDKNFAEVIAILTNADTETQENIYNQLKKIGGTKKC